MLLWLIKNLSVLVILVTAEVGNIAVAVTPVKLEPSPLNDPVNEPVKNVVLCKVVICWLDPTNDAILWLTVANSATEPETITFFQVAIYYILFYL